MLRHTQMLRLDRRAIDWFCRSVWPLFDARPQVLCLQLDITNACNLACDHCYHAHHHNAGALTFDQWVVVLQQYAQLLQKVRMVPQLTICGGEPILCPFLFPLIEHIRTQFGDCDLSLLSNGTRITEDDAILLKRLNVHVQISLDGPDASRHDVIRGAGSFDKTLAGCAKLKAHNVCFHHLAVLSQRTAPWIPDFFSLPQRTGAQAMNFTRLIIEGSAKHLVASGVDRPLEGTYLKSAMQTIWARSQRHRVRTATHGPLWHLIDPALGSPSNIGFSGFVIGYRGDFKVSSRISLTIGNVLTDSMEDLFLRHPIMQTLRRGPIDICGECQFAQKCRGDRNASYAKFGHMMGVDPGCWYAMEKTLAPAV